MLGDAREGGRKDGSTLALPIGLSSRKSRPGHFPKRVCACEARRVAASSRPVPKISGETRRSFYFPQRRGSSTPDLSHLLWREQENWNKFRSDSAVQEESR